MTTIPYPFDADQKTLFLGCLVGRKCRVEITDRGTLWYTITDDKKGWLIHVEILPFEKGGQGCYWSVYRGVSGVASKEGVLNDFLLNLKKLCQLSA